MHNSALIKKKLFEKLIKEKPHLSVYKADELAERLMKADEELLLNLREWVNGEPLSDIWIHQKYCIGAVMKIRDDGDFISAFLALDEYASDECKEQLLWQARK